MPLFAVEIIDEDGQTKIRVTFPDDFTWKKIDSIMDELDCSDEMIAVCNISENGNSTEIILPRGESKTAFLIFKNQITQDEKNALATASLPSYAERGKMPIRFSAAGIIEILEAKAHKYFAPDSSPKPPAEEKKGTKKRPWF